MKESWGLAPDEAVLLLQFALPSFSPPSFGVRGSPLSCRALAGHHELLPSLCSGKERAGERPEGLESISAWVGRRGGGASEETPIPTRPMAMPPAAP